MNPLSPTPRSLLSSPRGRTEMGYINQVSATAANSPKITISMWVRLDELVSSTDLLGFGNQNLRNYINAISLGHDHPTDGNYMTVGLHGVIDGVTDITPDVTTTHESL